MSYPGLRPGMTDRTAEGVWDVAGRWGDDLTIWGRLPNPNAPTRVPSWDLGTWDAPDAVWGPDDLAGAQVARDTYNGEAYWDSGDSWETDFWLTWE